MEKRIKELVEKFDLIAHPEGGYYREMYRSEDTLGNGKNLMTSIYFLLTEENPSKFHRIQSDELWYFHEGSELNVHFLTEKGHETHRLGLDVKYGQSPYLLVKGNTIFGSEVKEKNGYALVSCVVSPGFDFNEFELFNTKELLGMFPNEEKIIHRLT